MTSGSTNTPSGQPGPKRRDTHPRVAEVPAGSQWGAAAVVAAIAAIQLALPDSVTIGPRWLIPAIEVAGAAAIKAVWEFRPRTSSSRRTVLTFSLLLIVASALNAILLLRSLLTDVDESGQTLLFAGFGVLIINVLSFALVYWQIDGGGPSRRPLGIEPPDFQFPQQGPGSTWQPTLPDYLFTAYTNIIAFSPTDTMPLTHRVKLLFTIQSSISLVTVLVTLSRAINLIT